MADQTNPRRGRPRTGVGLPLNTRLRPDLHARVKASDRTVPELLEIALDTVGQ